jgi:hypothetical protein
MKGGRLTLNVLKDRFGVCRLGIEEGLPEWIKNSDFISLTWTPEELSIVCEVNCIPEDTETEKPWRCLKIKGPLDFGLTGILAGLSQVLAEAGIEIFAISTYNTDYILVREKELEHAIKVLSGAGYNFQD